MLFNNHKDCDSKQRFSIRKLTIGACSVLLSTLFLTTTNSQLVHAEEETSHNGSTDTPQQTSANQKNDKDKLEQKKRINASDLVRSAASDGDETETHNESVEGQSDASKASEKAPEGSSSGANSDAENKLKNENRGGSETTTLQINPRNLDVAGNGDALGESKVRTENNTQHWDNYRYILDWNNSTSQDYWDPIIRNQVMQYVLETDNNTGATFKSWQWNANPSRTLDDNQVEYRTGTLVVTNADRTSTTTYTNVSINMAHSIADYFRYKLGVAGKTGSLSGGDVDNFLTVVTHALHDNSVPTEDRELAINKDDVKALVVPNYTFTGDYVTKELLSSATWSALHATSADPNKEIRTAQGGVVLTFTDGSSMTIGNGNLNIIKAMPKSNLTFATSQVNQITSDNLPDITTDNANLGIANANQTYPFTINGNDPVNGQQTVKVNFGELFKPTYTWLPGDLDYQNIINQNKEDNAKAQTELLKHKLTDTQIAQMDQTGGQFNVNVLVQYHKPDGSNDGYQVVPVMINVKNLAKVVSVETNDDLIHINTPATDFTDATAKDAIKSLTYKDVNGNPHTVWPTDAKFNNLIANVAWSTIPTNDGTDAKIKVTFKDNSLNPAVKVNVVRGAAQNGLTVNSGGSFTTKYSNATSGISNTNKLSQWAPDYKWVNTDGSAPTYDTVWTPNHTNFTAYVQINYHKSATDNTADGSEIVPVTVNINQATATITQTGSASKTYDGQPISAPSVADILTNSTNWSTSGLLGSDTLNTATLTADDFNWYLGNQDLGKLSNTEITQIKNGTVGTYTIKLNSAGINALETANPNYKVTYSGAYTYTVSQASANANSITGSYTITYGDTPDFSKATDPYTVHLTTNPSTITGFTPSYQLTKGTQLQFRKHGTNENWSSTVPTDAGTYDVMISNGGWTDLKNAKGNSNITVNATGSTNLTTNATFIIKSKVTFEFVDDDSKDDADNPTVVGTPHFLGISAGDTVPFPVSVPMSYELAENQPDVTLNDGKLPANYTLSSNAGNTVTVTIHLVHAQVTVTPEDPKTPEDKLPNNPAKNYPTGVSESDLTKTVTRTIKVKDPTSGEEKIVKTQTADLSRSATVDEVTGAVTYSEWKLGTNGWKEYSAPEVSGYIPSQSKVAAEVVNGDTKDTSVTITYSPISQPATPDKPAQGSDQGTKPGSTPGSTPGEKPGAKPGTNPVQPTKPEVPGNKPHKPVKPNKPSKPTNGGSQNFKPSHNDQNFKPNSDDFPKGTHWENGKLVGPNGEIFYENGRLTRVGRAYLPQTGEKQNKLAAIFGALASGIGLLSLLGERKRKDND